jgi:ATP-binding cassette subfamily B protein
VSARDANVLDGVTWTAARTGEALAALADEGGLGTVGADPGRAPDGDPAALRTWLAEAARWRGIDLVEMVAPVADVATMIAHAAPALLRRDAGVIAVLGARGGQATVLAPDGGRRRVPIAALADELVASDAAPLAAEIDELLARTKLEGARRDRARRSMVAMRMRGVEVGGVHALRVPIDADVRRLAATARLARRFAGITALQALGYVLLLVSWWAIGRAALAGRLDSGWLIAWGGLLVTVVAVRGVGLWAMSGVSIDAGALLKQRLLAGALRLDADALRTEGVGRSLGRVFEGTAVEQLALTGGFAALFATLELIATFVVLGAGAGGVVHVALFAATLIAAWILTRRYMVARRAWTSRRLGLTHELIEAMVGHATRLAQEPPDLRHRREDRALATYAGDAATMDRSLTALQALLPRGWVVIGVAGL